jgi:NADH-ubiquinone oxidoreductase chain 2
MVLSSALDEGYVFMTLVAILTSVIGAGYYLNLIKQIFFYREDYKKNTIVNTNYLVGYILPYKGNAKNKANKVIFKSEDITISSSLSISISVITLLLILFIYMPTQ